MSKRFKTYTGEEIGHEYIVAFELDTYSWNAGELSVQREGITIAVPCSPTELDNVIAMLKRARAAVKKRDL